MVFAYLEACRLALASSVAFLFLSGSTYLALAAEAVKKTGLAAFPVTLFHVFGPHSGPSLACSPAPEHRAPRNQSWLLLMTLPPSNLFLMCIQGSARLVVKLLAANEVCKYVIDTVYTSQ